MVEEALKTVKPYNSLQVTFLVSQTLCKNPNLQTKIKPIQKYQK